MKHKNQGNEYNPKLEFIMTQRPPALCAVGIFIIILFLGLLHQNPVVAESYRAGFAKTNITPEVLREAAKKEMKTVREFPDRHHRDMPRTMLRYAIEWFDEQTRQSYLKGRLIAGTGV